jgi:hypothetical protein
MLTVYTSTYHLLGTSTDFEDADAGLALAHILDSAGRAQELGLREIRVEHLAGGSVVFGPALIRAGLQPGLVEIALVALTLKESPDALHPD